MTLKLKKKFDLTCKNTPNDCTDPCEKMHERPAIKQRKIIFIYFSYTLHHSLYISIDILLGLLCQGADSKLVGNASM